MARYGTRAARPLRGAGFDEPEIVDYNIIPWDRLVSAFHYLKKGGSTQEAADWARKELGRFNDFDGFVKGWLNKENIWKWISFAASISLYCRKETKGSDGFRRFFREH